MQIEAKYVQHLSYMGLVVLSLALLLCASVVLSLQGFRRSSNVEETRIKRLSSLEAREVYDDLLKATSSVDSLFYCDVLTGGSSGMKPSLWNLSLSYHVSVDQGQTFTSNS